MERTSVRGCVIGRTGSGKTWWAWRRWIAHARRVLIVDQTGEWKDLEPGARFAYGYADTMRALREVSPRSHFRVVAYLTNSEVYRLIQVLVPVPNIRSSPVLAIGGMMLYLDEVDLVIPTVAPESARSINRRSRHAQLSVISATQRVSNVSKEITSMADFLAILDIHEPACVDYLESIMGRERCAEALSWAEQPYHVALWLNTRRELKLLPPEQG